MPRRDPPIELEAVMAHRVYRVEGSEGPRNMRIAIAFPRRTPDGRYECSSEISDDDQRIVRPMNGVDAFEAVMLAIINIGTELHLFADLATDRFEWLDGKQAGLRFPALPEFLCRRCGAQRTT